MNEGRRQSDSFVLRIWWERDQEAEAWRGWVQHAASGSFCYFCCVSDLLAFVEAHSGPLSSGTRSKRNAVQDIP
ncbi:MAG: hypothetical protein JXD18_04930 [Anaerolineae bacterium]|nr:hypothetical protein [Anaerolineae bacterium]